MIRRIATLLVIAVAAAATVAGCGSSSSTTNSTSTPASTNAANSTSTPSTVSIPAADQAAVQEAVTACKSSVAAAPTLSSSEKTKLDSVCSDAASGNLAAAKSAAQQVCTQIVNSTPIPDSSAKQMAISACEKA